VAVVVFWLATCGWLFFREVQPELDAREPLVFKVELPEEAKAIPLASSSSTTFLPPEAIRRRQRNLARPSPYTDWDVSRNREKVGRLTTWIVLLERDDVFELHADYREKNAPPVNPEKTVSGPVRPSPVRATVEEKGEQFTPGRTTGEPGSWDDTPPVRVHTIYRVDRQGRFQGILARVESEGNSELFKSRPIKATLEGQVQNRLLSLRWSDSTPEVDLPGFATTQVSGRTGMLIPLHPLERISGLRAGEHWRVPLLDPSPIASLQGGAFLRYADAVVVEDELKRRSGSTPCVVIEYGGADAVPMRTWVRKSDGIVLRQDANLFGERVVVDLAAESLLSGLGIGGGRAQ
jgi:hypothetical protein